MYIVIKFILWRDLNIRRWEIESESWNNIVAYRCTRCSRALDYLYYHDTTIVTHDHCDTAHSFRHESLIRAWTTEGTERAVSQQPAWTSTDLLISVKSNKNLITTTYLAKMTRWVSPLHSKFWRLRKFKAPKVISRSINLTTYHFNNGANRRWRKTWNNDSYEKKWCKIQFINSAGLRSRIWTTH